MIGDNFNVSLEIVDYSIYIRRIALKHNYHEMRVDIFVYTPVHFNCLESLANIFVTPARKDQFVQEVIFKNALVHRISNAIFKNSAFTGSYTEDPLWYKQIDCRQIRLIRGDQAIVDFDASENCLLYVTTMKAMNFQVDITSIPMDNFKNHYVLVFDLTSM